MNKIIIEVGSTCTKVDRFTDDTHEKLDGRTIQLKKHYNEDNKLRKSDINELIDSVNELKNITDDIYVCGTSIFRSLNNIEKKEFLDEFKNKTGCEFNIISQDEENELTVFGATRYVKDKVCVYVSGGGSTEITTFDSVIKECVNSKFGIIDVMLKFPDLADDIAVSELDTVKEFIRNNLKFPAEKSDVLILAGGSHEKFARHSGIRYYDNNLYNDDNSPIMMDIETREIDTKKFFKEISLDKIRKISKDPDWWYATRAMCAFVLVIAEKVGAKYIVPTDIAMVYGILDKINKENA